jgi:hypothetical protein
MYLASLGSTGESNRATHRHCNAILTKAHTQVLGQFPLSGLNL